MNDPIKEPIFNGKAPLKYVDYPWIRRFTRQFSGGDELPTMIHQKYNLRGYVDM